MRKLLSGFVAPVRLLYNYRKNVLSSLSEELRQRYAGTLLGVFWAILYPLCLMSIYATLYVLVFRVRPAGLDSVGYTFLVLSGLIPLLCFAETFSTSASSLISNQALLLNTVFPVELLPVRSVLAGQVTMLMALCILVTISLWFGRIQWWGLFLIPVYWALLILFLVGISWTVSLLTLAFRDLSHAIGLINMIVVIASPAAYTAEMVPAGLKLIIYINPLSYFVRSFQSLICYGKLPSQLDTIVCVVLATTVFFASYHFHLRMKHAFIEYS